MKDVEVSSASDAAIRQALERIDFRLQGDSRLPVVEELLNATLLEGGKRLRPYLCLLYGALFRIPDERLERPARIAELVHAATLAHDDVIDEAKVRRGRRTLNDLTSNPQAILGGDLLLARASAEALRCGCPAIAMDLAATMEELVEGEWLQLEARGMVAVDRRHLERIASLKTASLLRWCCLAPLRIAGIDAELEELTRDFATLLGTAFQMIDDCLDFGPDSGKEFAKDFREGLINFVALEIMEASPCKRHLFEKTLGSHSSAFPWDAFELDAALEKVRDAAASKLDTARARLSEIVRKAEGSGLRTDATVSALLRELTVQMESRER